MEWAQDRVVLVVEDDGGGVAEPAPGGHGLIGMRERVAVFGGTFEAGPLSAGGYRVRVGLPYARIAAAVPEAGAR